MKSFFLFSSSIIAVTLLFASCKNDAASASDEEQLPLTVHTHVDSVLGWTLDVPSNWHIQSLKEIAETNQKGVESMENEVGQTMDLSIYSNVFSFVKDSSNMFQSVREKYEKSEDEWLKNNAALKQLFCNVYANQGARVDSSETTIVEIDGKKFYNYEILFYDKDDITMVQAFYSTLMNGYDFSVSLCATNEEDKQELVSIWENSQFKEED
ncbi:MAG: hypothetical protein HWE22_12470 [Flavobacteriales bacterium]|nr:hypothetical protein [Flavobacteriales bacterium]